MVLNVLSENKRAQIITSVAVSIGLFHNSVLFVYHAFCVLSKAKKILVIQRLSLLSMALTLVFQTALFLFESKLVHTSLLNCTWIIRLPVILWLFSKFSMYFLFLERLFRVFSNTDLEFKSLWMWTARLILSFWGIILLALIVLFVDGAKGEILINDCLVLVPVWCSGLMAFSDLTICTVISVLFARRLLMLHVSCTEKQTAEISIPQKTSNANDSALEVIRKSTLLSLVALLTTELSLALMVFGVTQLWISMDCMVNCWCILLIFRLHDRIFQSLCCLCQRCIGVRCLSCYSCNCC